MTAITLISRRHNLLHPRSAIKICDVEAVNPARQKIMKEVARAGTIRFLVVRESFDRISLSPKVHENMFKFSQIQSILESYLIVAFLSFAPVSYT